MQWTGTDKPVKFIQNQSTGGLCHEPETLKQVLIFDEALVVKEHALWIQNKVAIARASSQPLVPHGDVIKKAHA
jgi:hypothetical protein